MKLSINQLGKVYQDGNIALDGFNLELNEGVFGLLGPNGAGKSTLLEMLSLNLMPTTGEILWNGVDIQKNPMAFRRVLGYLPQTYGFYDELTTTQLLGYMGRLAGLGGRRLGSRIDECLERVNLVEGRKQKIKSFSGGMKQRLAIAQALIGSPEILVIDEPTTGLDPAERVSFRNMLFDLGASSVVIISTHIVKDVEFSCHQMTLLYGGVQRFTGEPGMFGLLGPNGAGKTTLMKILTGIVKPTYGSVHVAGHNLRRGPHVPRGLIGYLPQNFGLYPSLSLERYLAFFAPWSGLNDARQRRRKIDEVIEWVGLVDARDQPMKRFSGGMRQRAGIAQLLLNPHPILIVDEPTAGLDPVERVRFRLLLTELAQTRVVLLSTHIVDDVTNSCKKVAVLNRGEVVYEGNFDQIKATAEHLIWDLTLRAGQEVSIARKNILFKKRFGDRILYHYISERPLPDSVQAPANFEDAYIALLLRHEARFRSKSSSIPAPPTVGPSIGPDPLGASASV